MRATLVLCAWRRRCAGVCLAAAIAGCASPFSTNYLSGSRQQEAALAAVDALDPVVAAHDPRAASLRKANGEAPATADEALAGVLDQLREIGAIDPAAQQQLMLDLKEAKPEHYSLIVSQFQAALAYRQQLAQRDSDDGSQLATVNSAIDGAPAAEPASAKLASHAARRPVGRGGDAEDSSDVTAEPGADNEPVAAPAVAAAAAVMSPGPDAQLHQATLVGAGGNWRDELDAAIARLQREVRPQPATIAELHDHFRLSALLMLAGRDEEAYRPIPGASSAQQDYWSKQLFAMSAYLSGTAAIDDKQRAAGALIHLDEARAALAQMATLQIRNATFAKSVSGFGACEPLPDAKFQPGDKVTIYAEIENFASQSTAAGFQTVLGTSYQVVDGTGRRVEGGQFPDVTDVCRGRRRDFHLEYGVSLPTRIYPGEYRLELTITDQQSGKIGHASLPFEIAGGP